MREIIINYIQAEIGAITLYSIVMSILSILIIIMITFFKPSTNKERTILTHSRYGSYFFLCFTVFLMIITIPPRINLTINLLKDYNEQSILVKEGTVEERLSRLKLPMIRIDNVEYILSPDVERIEEGHLCKIEYFKYSKYINSLIDITDEKQ